MPLGSFAEQSSSASKDPSQPILLDSKFGVTRWRSGQLPCPHHGKDPTPCFGFALTKRNDRKAGVGCPEPSIFVDGAIGPNEQEGPESGVCVG